MFGKKGESEVQAARRETDAERGRQVQSRFFRGGRGGDVGGGEGGKAGEGRKRNASSVETTAPRPVIPEHGGSVRSRKR